MVENQTHGCPVCRINSAQSYFRSICQNRSKDAALSEVAQRFQLDEHEISYIREHSPTHSDPAEFFQKQLPLIYDILNEVIQSLSEKYQPIVQTYLTVGGDMIETANQLGNTDVLTVKHAVQVFHRKTREPSVQNRIKTRLYAVSVKED